MAIRTPRDAYHRVKEKHPDAILAFGVGDMLEFLATDAHDMARMLQLEVTRPNGYDVAVVHNSQYFQLKERLRNLGREMLLVSRKRSPRGKVIFMVEET